MRTEASSFCAGLLSEQGNTSGEHGRVGIPDNGLSNTDFQQIGRAVIDKKRATEEAHVCIRQSAVKLNPNEPTQKRIFKPEESQLLSDSCGYTGPRNPETHWEELERRDK